MFTNAGIDWIHAQLLVNTSAGTRGANFVALSENATAISASDTTIASEITTNGLARILAGSIVHTASTNVTTMIHTFTCNTAPFTTVQKGGLLNAASAGTLLLAKLFTSTALNIGDLIEVTITVTGP